MRYKELRRKVGMRCVDVLAAAQVLIYRHVIRDTYWRSANGQVHFVSEMSNRHLQNAFSLLRREGRGNCAQALALEAEIAKRYFGKADA